MIITKNDDINIIVWPNGFSKKLLNGITTGQSPGKWRVSGSLRVDDFRREYPNLGEPQEVETMGGLLIHLLEVVPGPGESAGYRGLKLTAHVTDERRVRELLVEVVK